MSASPSPRVRRELPLIYVMMFAYPAFQSIVQTLTPLRMADLGLSKAMVGVVQAMPGVMVLLAGAPFARLANTRWAHRALTACFSLSALAALLYTRADSAPGFLVPQFLFGATSSCFYCTILAMTFRLARGPQQERIQGTATALQGLGCFVAPLLAGALSRLGPAAGFYAGAACALVGIGASLGLPAPRAVEPSASLWVEIRGAYPRLLRVISRRPMVLVGAGFVFLNCFLLYVMGGSFFLLYANQIGIAATWSAALISVRELAAAGARLQFGRLCRVTSPVLVLGVGSVCAAAVLGLVPAAGSATGLLAIAVLLGATAAFVPPAVNLLSGASAAPEEQSFAIVGLNLSNFAAQTTLAPLLGLLVGSTGYAVAYPATAALWIALSGALLVVALRAARRASDGEPAAAAAEPALAPHTIEP